MKDLNSTGLLEIASLHVVLSGGNSQHAINEAEKLIRQSVAPMKSIAVTVSRDNQYEYAGILELWKIAKKAENPNKTIILYFHSKGMVNYNRRYVEVRKDLYFHKTVIVPWRSALQHFNEDDGLNKAGAIGADGGWIWYNYMWARGSYLIQLPGPIRSKNRYYYEDWLGIGNLFANITTEKEGLNHNPGYRMKKPREEYGAKGTCYDSWSMCLGFYERGLVFHGQNNICNNITNLANAGMPPIRRPIGDNATGTQCYLLQP